MKANPLALTDAELDEILSRAIGLGELGPGRSETV
jgi:hypothetical protein